jgi:hypothetical protein
LILPLLTLWSNSHGGFIVAFLLWVSYLVDGFVHAIGRRGPADGPLSGLRSALKANRLWVIMGGAMVLAVSINPSGPMMLLYPFKTISIGALREYIQEWQSPDFHSLQIQPFLWLLLLTLGAVGFSRRRMEVRDFLMVSGFAYLALTAGRNIALFALVAPLPLTRHLVPLFRGWRQRWGLGSEPGGTGSPPAWMKGLNTLLVVVVLLAVIVKALAIYPEEINEAHFKEIFPVQAVTVLQRERPAGRLFNSYNWGGYLLWALPEYRVFIDGRTDLYDDEVIAEWLQVVRGEAGWRDVVNRWEIRAILLESDMPVIPYLEQDGWRLLYGDRMAVVYVR